MASRSRRRKSKSSNSYIVIFSAIIFFVLIAGVVGTGAETTQTPNANTPSSSSAPSSSVPGNSESSAPSSSSSAPTSEALTQLNALTVASKSSAPGYSRDEFGTAWKDIDDNSCDTRNDILARDLTNVVRENDNCTVLSGTLNDPYTGQTINFVRGRATSSAVQIDHKIPLSLSWTQGAAQWSESKREAFANDPLNLIAVDGPTNGSKSDSSSDEWLPPNKNYWCTYATDQVVVKTKYELSITSSEKSTLQGILSSC